MNTKSKSSRRLLQRIASFIVVFLFQAGCLLGAKAEQRDTHLAELRAINQLLPQFEALANGLDFSAISDHPGMVITAKNLRLSMDYFKRLDASQLAGLKGNNPRLFTLGETLRDKLKRETTFEELVELYEAQRELNLGRLDNFEAISGRPLGVLIRSTLTGEPELSRKLIKEAAKEFFDTYWQSVDEWDELEGAYAKIEHRAKVMGNVPVKMIELMDEDFALGDEAEMNAILDSCEPEQLRQVFLEVVEESGYKIENGRVVEQ